MTVPSGFTKHLRGECKCLIAAVVDSTGAIKHTCGVLCCGCCQLLNSSKLRKLSMRYQNPVTTLIRGRESIFAFFDSILPAVRSLKFLRYYTSDGGWVAGQAELSLANGKTAIRARRILR